MKNLLTILIGSALLITSCNRAGRSACFTIDGEILEAEGKTLYFDWLSLSGVEILDSVTLDGNGHFLFTGERPECFDFYRLRIGDKVINLAVDSTETITVKASLPSMSTSYDIEGSEDSRKLQELVMLQMQLQRDINKLAKSAGPETGILAERINEKVDLFKSETGMEYIFKCPDKPCAYYALFMSINGSPLFRPQELRQDAKYFASVATSMDMRYPDAVRTSHLHNVALKGMKATAAPAPVSDDVAGRLAGLVTETGVIDVALPDIDGVTHHLTDLKGNVVLLDFTAFKTDFSIEYNLMLRELYDKFAGRGFEIYQVSVDVDEHYWMTTAGNLPWICVHDEDNIESEYLQTYRVETLPTAFLLDRNNEITERMQDYRDLEAHIEKLLE